MTIILGIVLLVVAYLVGAIPFGLLIVKLSTGQDIRTVGSGRTGGTNVMRAAGFGAGLLTAVLDMLKGAVPIWLTRALLPEVAWLAWAEVFVGALAVLGHNHSVFLIHTKPGPAGRRSVRIPGGAGGATTVGGAVGLWPWSAAIVIPAGAAILFGIGYASVATLSVAVMIMIVMGVRAHLGLGPWEYVAYGALCFGLQIWTLRPNIRRLFNGTERLVGWRAMRVSGKMTADRAAPNQD